MTTEKDDPEKQKTHHAIIRAAEKLFAEKGFRAMTLRDVTQEAQVNLAAVNYHFGSKLNLVCAVVSAHFEPINAERLWKLNKAIAANAPHPVPLEQIFKALFQPLFTSASDKRGPNRVLIKLVGRAMTEPSEFMQQMHKKYFAELCARFMTEIQRSCPHLSTAELHYRFFFAVSTMIGTVIEPVRLQSLSSEVINPTDYETMVAQLTDFVVAAFQKVSTKP